MLTERQEVEIDSLQAIFADTEIQRHDDGLTILLVPHPTLPLESNHVALRLRITLPATYPDSADPSIEPLFKKNLDTRRWDAIDEIIRNVKTDNQGFEMLFELYSQITQWLQENDEPLRSVFDDITKGAGTKHMGAELDDGASDTESSGSSTDGRLADKNLVPPDHRVTAQQFESWRNAFREEMIARGIWKDEALADPRPTGRELFLNTRATAENEAKPNEEKQLFWKDTNLFDLGEIDDIDLEVDDLDNDS